MKNGYGEKNMLNTMEVNSMVIFWKVIRNKVIGKRIVQVRFTHLQNKVRARDSVTWLQRGEISEQIQSNMRENICSISATHLLAISKDEANRRTSSNRLYISFARWLRCPDEDVVSYVSFSNESWMLFFLFREHLHNFRSEAKTLNTKTRHVYIISSFVAFHL